MDAAFVIRGFLPEPVTGTIQHVDHMARSLASRGHRVTVHTSAPAGLPGVPARETRDGYEIVRHRARKVHGHYSTLEGIRASLEASRPNVVVANEYRNGATDAAALAARRLRLPLVLMPCGSLLGYRHVGRSLLTGLPNRLYDAATRRMAVREADLLVLTSLAEAEDARRFGVPESKMRVIPHGLDLREPPARDRAPDLVLTVGRITPARDHPFLLRAFARVAARRPGARLRVVGGEIPGRAGAEEREYPEAIRSLARELGVADRVEWTGHLPPERVAEEYAQAAVFAYSSSYDSFGLALVEAAWAGLPIVSRPVGAAPDLLRGGLVRHLARTPEEMADALVRLLEDPALAREASAALREAAREFSMEAVVARHERVYEEAIALRRDRR